MYIYKMEVRSFGAVFALHNHSHHPARSLQSLANVRKFVKTLRGEINTTVAIGLPILRKFIGMKNHVTFGHSNLCFVWWSHVQNWSKLFPGRGAMFWNKLFTTALPCICTDNAPGKVYTPSSWQAWCVQIPSQVPRSDRIHICHDIRCACGFCFRKKNVLVKIPFVRNCFFVVASVVFVTFIEPPRCCVYTSECCWDGCLLLRPRDVANLLFWFLARRFVWRTWHVVVFKFVRSANSLVELETGGTCLVASTFPKRSMFIRRGMHNISVTWSCVSHPGSQWNWRVPRRVD